jgi:hypothetical protein
MDDNPCQYEKETALRAAEEWERASEAARRFVITKPLNPEEPLTPKSPEYLDEMRIAFDQEAEARRRYMDAMSAWHECEKGRA